MTMFVNTNISSINAQRQLMSSGGALTTSFERLSSGFRINSAADDAAGLQITDRMTTQVQGLQQAVRNANDGISVAQTAEGAMQEVTQSLQRIRQLAVQAQNGINTSTDRKALQKEVSALKTEIARIGSTTQFAGVDLLKGDYSQQFLVGANKGQTIDVKVNVSITLAGLNITNMSVGDATAAANALSTIDGAISKIGGVRADLGAIQNRFQSTIRNLSNVIENVSNARSQIKDTDFATETAELTRAQILQQASQTVLQQANQRPQAALSLLGG